MSLLAAVAAAVLAAAVVAAAAVAVAAAAVFAVVAVVMEAVVEGLDILLGSRAVYKDLSLEGEVTAGEGMVEVHADDLLPDSDDLCEEAVAVGILQGQCGAELHMITVEFPVDSEDALVEVDDALVKMFTEGRGSGEREAELLSGLKVGYFLFEGFKGDAHLRDEDKGLAVLGLFQEVVTPWCGVIELVGCLDISFHKMDLVAGDIYRMIPPAGGYCLQR